MKFTHILLLVTIGIYFAGCSDKAAPGYAQCIQLNIQGDVRAAWDACSAAISASPTSETGKSAAAKLMEIKPKYEVWKAAYDKKVAVEQAAAAKAQARAEAKAKAEAKRAKENRFSALQEKISASPTGSNASCRNKGLPPYEYNIEGGTISENREYARMMGCRSLPMGGSFSYDNFFCCP